MAETDRVARSRRTIPQASDAAGGLAEIWRRLNFEQRVATVAALLLIVSTFGPFSFVEAAIVLTAFGVLALVKKRADRKRFHLPFGDGTVIFAAGIWSALLIVIRLFDRELGQSVLALVCAAILAGAGARERAKRPADDLPVPRAPLPQRGEAHAPPVQTEAPSQPDPDPSPRPQPDPDPSPRPQPDPDPTERLATRDAPTERRRASRRR